MAGRPKRDGHGRPRYELQIGLAGRKIRLGLPTVDVRPIPTGARPPAPGSRAGSSGMPKHNFRCPDDVWGAAINAAADRRLELGPVLRGYVRAFARGEAPVFPDPCAPGSDVDA